MAAGAGKRAGNRVDEGVSGGQALPPPASPSAPPAHTGAAPDSSKPAYQ